MIKNILIGLAGIIVIAGGWWYFSASQSTESSTVTPTVPTGTDTSVANTDTTASSPTPTVHAITVNASDYRFDVATMSVKKGDTVTVTFINNEGRHDWVIDEFNARTSILGVGGSETITFVADKVGSFEYYCSVGKHREFGMKGMLTVTE